MSTLTEYVPGMRQQGKGIKVYVESEYAPAKALLVGNPSSIYIPDPDTWENANLLAHSGEELKAYLRKNKGKNLKDTDPEIYEKIAAESNALADEALKRPSMKSGKL